jgi:SAM-dependent methyltransferase
VLTIDLERFPIRSGDVVLDIGCGSGRHGFASLRRGATVVSVDLDPDSLQGVRTMSAAMAHNRQTPPHSSNHCLCGDATRLPFANGSFDIVIASEVMEHIRADEAALAEFLRVLKPGGRLAVSVPRTWPERVCWFLSSDYHNEAGGHVRIYRNQELRAKLRDAGFAVWGQHHAHALHSPYWWLKCAVGMRKEDAPLPRLYHRLLVWQIRSAPTLLDALEHALDPFMGKSLVVYATNVEPAAVMGTREASALA